jgi:hypothetical protein
MTCQMAVVPLLVLLSLAATQAQSDPWYQLSARPRDFVATRPWNTFTIDLPKEWQLAPGYGPILLSAVEKTRSNQPAASIVIEHRSLAEPLTAQDVDAGLAGLEANDAKGRDPAGQDFKQEVKEVNGVRFVFLTYSRRGLSGMDTVIQYSVPSGSVMYRLVCIAPTAQLAQRYQAIFAHVAASFKPVAAKPG